MSNYKMIFSSYSNLILIKGKNLIFLMLISFLVSCNGKGDTTRYNVVDYLEVRNLLDSLNQRLQQDFDSSGSYEQPVQVLNNGKKALIFFGANHSRDLNHPQFKQLRKLFNEFKPEITINEGGQVPSDRHYASLDSAAAKAGELGVLKYMSDSAGISMMNGDLEEDKEFPELLKTVSADELYLYIAVERYLNLYTHNRFPGLTLQESFDQKFLPYLEDNGFTLTEEQRSLSYLQSIYKKYLHKDFDLDSIVGIHEYYLTDTGTFGKVGRATKIVRDDALLKKIDKALDKYDRVFVVFGASHLFAVRPALRQIIDKPRQ